MTHPIRTLMAALALFSTLTGPLFAKDFLDDFEDGSATDGTPVTWKMIEGYPTTLFSVANGDLRVTSSADWADAVLGASTTMADTSIRAQVRVEGVSDEGAAVYARGDTSSLKSYNVQVARDGLMYLNVAGSLHIVDTGLLPLDEDVVLQLDVIGNMISTWAWRPSDPMPQAPLISLVDDQLASGIPGVFMAKSTLPQTSAGTAIFRYVQMSGTHISDVPEPSTWVLAMLAVVGVVAMRRCRP